MDEIDSGKNPLFWTDLWWGDLFYMYIVLCFLIHFNILYVYALSKRLFMTDLFVFFHLFVYTDIRLPYCMDKYECHLEA